MIVAMTGSGTTIRDILLSAESIFIGILIIAIIVQSLLTLFAPSGVRRVSALLYDLTDPILTPIRRSIPPFGMFDLSPMVAILLLIIAGWVLQWLTLLLSGG